MRKRVLHAKRRSHQIGQILDYKIQPASQNTVRRAYERWRISQELPVWCDNETCSMHVPDPNWNGRLIRMILDHIDGNRKNNRTGNLWFLCHNCNSQTPTYGGKNKGRIRNETRDSYHVLDRDGQREVKVMLGGQSSVTGQGQVKPKG